MDKITLTKKPLISIIVPVYNVDNYLARCIDSILCQTHENLEVILVDDGSTDKSGDICDSYARSDARVRVIHQKNAGVSSARNAGLDVAGGVWIGFIDSDDWVMPTMYEKLLSAAVGNDKQLAFCAYNCYRSQDEQKQMVHIELPDILSKEKMLTYLLDPNKRFYTTRFFCYIYHTDLFRNDDGEHLRFDKNIHYSEDRLFLTQILIASSGAVYVKDALYYYFQRENSAIHTINEKRLTIVDALSQIIETVKATTPEIEKSAQVYFVRRILDLVSLLCHFKQYTYVPKLRKRVRPYILLSLSYKHLSIKNKIENLTVLLFPKKLVGLLSTMTRRTMNKVSEL